MVTLKVAIQAVRRDPEDETKDQERMVIYDVSGETEEEAVAEAKSRFALEMQLDGWQIAGLGTIR
ncbi:hypothetical protein [Desulfohalovibrio reitneri]|uniref:hypothetical protein n=1 Tax=Desulfohalovibrio reitneri TaxID=1307759 RepID=UPI0004A6EBBA|nr:hypothetical protein [Desulfohalovibrio reitneri]